ncbi:MAG TPA: hypothetical protein VHP33_10990 [Polyangiaceae bacterium]|nr:hypothetical protein [Polyangiaceae bacterium]
MQLGADVPAGHELAKLDVGQNHALPPVDARVLRNPYLACHVLRNQLLAPELVKNRGYVHEQVHHGPPALPRAATRIERVLNVRRANRVHCKLTERRKGPRGETPHPILPRLEAFIGLRLNDSARGHLEGFDPGGRLGVGRALRFQKPSELAASYGLVVGAQWHANPDVFAILEGPVASAPSGLSPNQ